MLCFLTGPPEKVFKISGLIQLLNLKFDGIKFGFGSTKYLSKFQISAPKLESFDYKKSLAMDFDGLDLPSLKYVDVRVSQSSFLLELCTPSCVFMLVYWNYILLL